MKVFHCPRCNCRLQYEGDSPMTYYYSCRNPKCNYANSYYKYKRYAERTRLLAEEDVSVPTL